MFCFRYSDSALRVYLNSIYPYLSLRNMANTTFVDTNIGLIIATIASKVVDIILSRPVSKRYR